MEGHGEAWRGMERQKEAKKKKQEGSERERRAKKLKQAGKKKKTT